MAIPAVYDMQTPLQAGLLRLINVNASKLKAVLDDASLSKKIKPEEHADIYPALEFESAMGAYLMSNALNKNTNAADQASALNPLLEQLSNAYTRVSIGGDPFVADTAAAREMAEELLQSLKRHVGIIADEVRPQEAMSRH